MKEKKIILSEDSKNNKLLNNRWMRAAVPALLIHCSIGTVYCWSTFKEAIANQIGMSTFSVGWAFSFAIFFLGMSAAFAGRMVEKDIKKSSLISCLFFTAGMIGTGFFIDNTTGVTALIGIYICYGFIMGIGLGVGYITPVKTLMLWFKDKKGLATGISIMGFGLAKAIATPIMEIIQRNFGVASMFYILGAVYFVMMITGHLLIRKPAGWVEAHDEKSRFRKRYMFKDRTFTGIWLMFFINIHCGLMLISYEKQLLSLVFAASASLAVIVSTVPSVTAAMNALGRIGFSTLSDQMSDRNTIYKVIFVKSLIVSCMSFVVFIISGNSYSGIAGVCVILLLVVVNAGYGGGFSTLPALLSSRYGMKNVSEIHGLALSAWAIAGLTGNNTTEMILEISGGSYTYIFAVAALLYIIAFVVSSKMIASKGMNIEIQE